MGEQLRSVLSDMSVDVVSVLCLSVFTPWSSFFIRC